MIDLNNSCATPWNKRVISVFTSDFLKSGWYKCTNKDEIQKRFKTHMEYLITTYKIQMKEARSEAGSDVAAAHRLSMAARRRRKLEVRRRDTHEFN